MRYSSFQGKPQTRSNDQSEDGFDTFILVFVFAFIVLVIVILVGVVLHRKRRQIKEMQVTYVANPNAVQSDVSLKHEAMVS